MTISTVILLEGSQATGDPSSPTSSASQVIHAEFSAARPLSIPNTVSLESLISGFESDPEMAAAMQQARRNLAYSLYGDEPETLTVLRLSAGLSQVKLAQMVGTSQPHIARIEGGRTDPGTEMIAKLAAALAVSEQKAFKAIRQQRARQEKIK